MDFPFPFLESLTLPVDAGPTDPRIVINEDNSGTIRVYDVNGDLAVQIGGVAPFDNAISFYSGDPDEDFPATISAGRIGVGGTRNIFMTMIGPAFSSAQDFPFLEVRSQSFDLSEDAEVAIDLDQSDRGHLRIPSQIGEAVLVAGTVTVTRADIAATTRIFLSRRVAGGTLGNLTYTITAGVSFTINSSSATDTSTVEWMLISE
jgi:hypothetical protein